MGCKLRNLKIYMAGAMSKCKTREEMNGWRISLKNALADTSWNKGYPVQIINPVDYYDCEHPEENRQSESEARDFDIHHVVTSDIVVVNLKGLSTSEGTKIELHDANYNNRIPVIAFGDKWLYDELHPWIKMNITRVEKNIDDVVNYISNFYMS